MATVIWGGTVSTDKDADANYVGGAKPGAGDTWIWNSITPYAPTSGTWTNASAVFIVTSGAGWGTGNNISRDVGTTSSPFVLSAVSTSATFGNLGNVYVGSTGTVALASFEMPRGSSATLSSGTWTQPIGTLVTMNVGASAAITNPWSNGSVWHIAASGTAITLLKGNGTFYIASRTITAGTVVDSRVVTTGTTAITALTAMDSVVNHQGSGNATCEVIGSQAFFTPMNNPNGTGTVPTATVTVGYGATATLSVPGITLAGTITYKGPQYAMGETPVFP